MSGHANKLYIVIPAYNEEANIETVAREWHDTVVSTGADSRILIIDDGSKDSTYTKLYALKKMLPQLEVVTKTNSGHGPTVLYGYRYALDQGAGYVFQTDSDGQTKSEEFGRLWEARKDYDIQIGFRKGRQDGGSRIFVTKVLQFLLFLQFGIWIKDANTPFRLMSGQSLHEVLRYIPENSTLPNTLMAVFYHKRRKKILYRHISFRPRQGGINSLNFKKIVKIGWQALGDFSNFKKGI